MEDIFVSSTQIQRVEWFRSRGSVMPNAVDGDREVELTT